MTTTDMLAKIEETLNRAKTGVLATVDRDGAPHMRWMTPAVLQGRAGCLYAITSPAFAKIIQLNANPAVEWLIQVPSLKEIISIKGSANVIVSPALNNEIVSAIGKHLFVFWNVNPKTDVVALETVMHSATFFAPMSGVKESVVFRS